MPNVIKYLVHASLIVMAISNSAWSQDFETYTVPRTVWGLPDLQGVWNFSSNTPMVRPDHFGMRQYLTSDEIEDEKARIARYVPEDPAEAIWFEQNNIGEVWRTSLIVYPENGKPPPLLDGVPRQSNTMGDDIPGMRPVRSFVGGIAKNGPEDRGLTERCLVGFNSGPPFSPGVYNNNVQLIQNKDTVIIMTEMIHDARIVPLADKPPLDSNIRLWAGDSYGWWEGDTLFVETKNFNGLRATFGTIGSNYDMVLTERFERKSDSSMEYEFTIDDPSTFTDKLTVSIGMTKIDEQIYEYACHEGNDAMLYVLRGARMEESVSPDSTR